MKEFLFHSKKRVEFTMRDVESISCHPAVAAWRSVAPNAGGPQKIDILKFKNKSKVFRLSGIGPDNLSIVAKGSLFKHLCTEQAIYEQVLPHCPFPTAKYYGLLKKEEQELSWLFVEDARGEDYDVTNKAHRLVAMEWLGSFHTCLLPSEKASFLPDKSLSRYHGYLHKGHGNILSYTKNSCLTKGHLSVLMDILSQFEKIAGKWDQIESSCESVPLSFIHGDFKNLNVKIRQNNSKNVLIPFDWASGGWGVPAVDLGGMVYDASKTAPEELKIYASMMKGLWPGLHFRDFQRLTYIGKALMLIYIIYAEGNSLETQWIWKPMKRMGYYRDQLSEVLNVLKW